MRIYSKYELIISGNNGWGYDEEHFKVTEILGIKIKGKVKGNE